MRCISNTYFVDHACSRVSRRCFDERREFCERHRHRSGRRLRLHVRRWDGSGTTSGRNHRYVCPSYMSDVGTGQELHPGGIIGMCIPPTCQSGTTSRRNHRYVFYSNLSLAFFFLKFFSVLCCLLQSDLVRIQSCLGNYSKKFSPNKKALLRERKRHITHRVTCNRVSCTPAVLTGVGGTPSPPVLTWDLTWLRYPIPGTDMGPVVGSTMVWRWGTPSSCEQTLVKTVPFPSF